MAWQVIDQGNSLDYTLMERVIHQLNLGDTFKIQLEFDQPIPGWLEATVRPMLDVAGIVVDFAGKVVNIIVHIPEGGTSAYDYAPYPPTQVPKYYITPTISAIPIAAIALGAAIFLIGAAIAATIFLVGWKIYKEVPAGALFSLPVVLIIGGITLVLLAGVRKKKVVRI